MKHFTAILTALAILLGISACYSTTPVPTHTPASVEILEPSLPATPATPASPTPEACQEGDPCWDCATMGNRSCGMDAETATMDAWDSFDHVPAISPSEYEIRVDYSHTVRYVPTLEPTEILVPSINVADTYHIFRYVATKLHHV